MIITSLQGGLGNQMFQYAYGESLSIKYKTDLQLDISNLPMGVPPRNFELDIFGINGPFAPQATVKRLLPPLGWLRRRSPRLDRLINLRTTSYLNEKYSMGRMPNFSGDLYLDGYWQSEDFFCDNKNEIRKCFTFQNTGSKYAKKWLAKINKGNSVSVHVRRTDYVNRSGRAEIIGCSLGYYREAMSLIARKVKNPTFYIFSDDLSWSRKNMRFSGFKIKFLTSVDLADHNIDMFLMSQCNHHVVANSSFSWWGAWLNPNPRKIVVAPDPWFNSIEAGRKEIIPPTWFKIAKQHA